MNRKAIRPRAAIAAAVLGVSALVGTAGAQTLSYSLTLEPSAAAVDHMRFTLVNTSTVNQAISNLGLSIGDTAFNYDALVGGSVTASPNVGGSLQSPDAAQNAARSDQLAYVFSGLVPPRSFAATIELDPDTGDSTGASDFSQILFNNGDAPNALLSVRFADGTILSQTLPDGTAPGNVFTFTQAVPEPAVAVAAAVLAPFLLGRRRQSLPNRS